MLSDNVVASADVTGSAVPTCGYVNVVDSSLLSICVTNGSLDQPCVNGVISREEHVSVSTMISMSKFDFSDMGKHPTSWRKIENPPFETQYLAILNAMKLDRLQPLPTDAKVIPVATEFMS